MPQVSVKGRIIEHAEDVLRRRGYNAASVNDITTAAGVPKGSFYNHFDSKEELVIEIVNRYASATDLSTLTGGGSSLERLRAHFVAQDERTQGTGIEFGCLFGTFASDSPITGDRVRTAVREGLDAWISAIAETVRAGQGSGEITSAQPAEVLAVFLVDAFEGSALHAKVTGVGTTVRVQMDIALGALRP